MFIVSNEGGCAVERYDIMTSDKQLIDKIDPLFERLDLINRNMKSNIDLGKLSIHEINVNSTSVFDQ